MTSLPILLSLLLVRANTRVSTQRLQKKTQQKNKKTRRAKYAVFSFPLTKLLKIYIKHRCLMA